jgi:hypothetical protein
MTFRYRSFPLAPLALLLGAALAGALAALLAPDAGPVNVLLPAPAAAAGALLWMARRDEAARQGVLVLDGAGLRRVRGDGRVLHAVHWEEIRAVRVDPRGREATVHVPGGSFPVRAAAGPGGVGLEHFGAFLAILPDYTDAPVGRPGYSTGSSRGRWASDSFTRSAGYSKSSSFPEK